MGKFKVFKYKSPTPFENYLNEFRYSHIKPNSVKLLDKFPKHSNPELPVECCIEFTVKWRWSLKKEYHRSILCSTIEKSVKCEVIIR